MLAHGDHGVGRGQFFFRRQFRQQTGVCRFEELADRAGKQQEYIQPGDALRQQKGNEKNQHRPQPVGDQHDAFAVHAIHQDARHQTDKDAGRSRSHEHQPDVERRPGQLVDIDRRGQRGQRGPHRRHQLRQPEQGKVAVRKDGKGRPRLSGRHAGTPCNDELNESEQSISAGNARWTGMRPVGSLG